MTSPFPRLGDRREEVEQVTVTEGVPIADFSAGVVSGHTMQFTDLSSDPGGAIVAWEWDFGDAPIKPVANFTYVPNALTAQFTDASFDLSPGFLVAWAWNFGDGGTSNQQNPSHTYTAAATYNVTLTVTDNDGLTSIPVTRQVVVSGGGGGGGGSEGNGRPFGLAAILASPTALKSDVEPFNLIHDGVTPSTVVKVIALARRTNMFLFSNMTSGAHSRYKTNGSFDMAKWQAAMDGFRGTQLYDNQGNAVSSGGLTVRQHVANAVSDGIFLGNSMIDEPSNQTNYPNDPAWGPSGIPGGKATLDQMARYCRGIFPTLPMGIVGRYDWHEPSETYQDVDFVVSQYSFRQPAGSPGNVELFADEGNAMADRNNVAWVSGMNTEGGGYRGRAAGTSVRRDFPIINVQNTCISTDATLDVLALEQEIHAPAYLVFPSGAKATVAADAAQGANVINLETPHDQINAGQILNPDPCPIPFTNGQGDNFDTGGLCKPSPDQFYYTLSTLASRSVALRLWWWDLGMMSNPTNKARFQDIRTLLNNMTRPRWSRR